VPVLLVASDYDGTISPIVDDPREARPHGEAIIALRNLSRLPQTHVAVISGRSLQDLHERVSFPEDVHLVGSHGSEFDLGFTEQLGERQLRLREVLRDRLGDIAEAHPGFFVEEKPGSLAFHYRLAPDDLAAQALEEIEHDIVPMEDVHARRGKKVIELAVIETSKGSALEAIRRRVGASAAIYLGDDRTDEDAFARLAGPDVGVKVGEGETSAAFRIDSTEESAKLLARLYELREDWLGQSQAVEIDHHAMLSDQRTAALVAPGGRIVWMCTPRIDSAAIFAELLGGPAAGHFTVRPAGEAGGAGEMRYRPDSLVLETHWPGVTLTDWLDCSPERSAQRAGRTDLIRLVAGAGHAELEFAPRLNFGRTITRLTALDGGLRIEDTVEPIVLYSPGVEWTIESEGPHDTARARIRLGPEPRVLELRVGTGSLRDRRDGVRARLDGTDRYWSGWTRALKLGGEPRDLLARSALVLKGLTYGPTGAISAAATTSLPEHVGGVRNWDYRFCWLRDAAYSASALVKLGSIGEAIRYLDWVLGILDRDFAPERLRPVYTVTGGDLPPEAEVSELPGYRGSRPVRIGNAASEQIQLDVFGPIVDLIWLLLEHDAPLSMEHWRLVTALVSAVSERWDEPDHGIWEVRTERRHHVHSKTMCWVTVDRACRIAEHFGRDPREGWPELRDRIAADVLEHGWSPEAGAYTSWYGSEEIDAAVLELGLTGLVPRDDERFLATVEAVERELRRGPAVYRYRFDDGLPGFEGGFHLCTSWLVRVLAGIGRGEDAAALYSEMIALVGPTGLLSEEWGVRTERALGNHPQAYSHLGIIESALALARLRAPAG
jgi:trehalose-phosphatase